MGKHNRVQVCKPKDVLGKIESGRRENSNCWSVEDVRKAVKKLKRGKSPGVDGITSEMLKCGGECLLEWLRTVCNVCFRRESTK